MAEMTCVTKVSSTSTAIQATERPFRRWLTSLSLSTRTHSLLKNKQTSLGKKKMSSATDAELIKCGFCQHTLNLRPKNYQNQILGSSKRTVPIATF